VGLEDIMLEILQIEDGPPEDVVYQSLAIILAANKDF